MQDLHTVIHDASRIVEWRRHCNGWTSAIEPNGTAWGSVAIRPTIGGADQKPERHPATEKTPIKARCKADQMVPAHECRTPDCEEWPEIALSLSEEIDQAIHDAVDSWRVARVRQAVTGRRDADTRKLADNAEKHLEALQAITRNQQITESERAQLTDAVRRCRRCFRSMLSAPKPPPHRSVERDYSSLKHLNVSPQTLATRLIQLYPPEQQAVWFYELEPHQINAHDGDLAKACAAVMAKRLSAAFKQSHR